MLLDVCFLPAELPERDLRNTLVIVTDVLRASSTICAALAKGFEEIHVHPTLEEAHFAKQHAHHPHLQLLAGEVQCLKPEGFDFGNSPTEILEHDMNHTRCLHFMTSNGTRMLLQSSAAAYQFVGGLVNVDVTVAYIQHLAAQNLQLDTILVCCAGTQGGFSLEDSLFAGTFARRYIACQDSVSLTDAARAAVCIANAYENNINTFITHAHHAQRLIQLGFRKDVELCLSLNAIPLVAQATNGIIRRVHDDRLDVAKK